MNMSLMMKPVANSERACAPHLRHTEVHDSSSLTHALHLSIYLLDRKIAISSHVAHNVINHTNLILPCIIIPVVLHDCS